MRIVQLAHDLDDSAVWRRADMLRAGGAEVTLAGFRRRTGALPGSAIILGQTRDGRLLTRAGSVLAVLPRIARRVPEAAKADVVIARNLEMLMLGAALTRRTGSAALVYELLDVHRLLSGSGLASRLLRSVETALLRRCSGIMISSPGFLTGYLQPFARPLPALRLVENKPFAGPEVPVGAVLRDVEPRRLTLGWFGILRCAWSLDVLDRLCRAHPGRLRVVLRGRPALDQMPDFHARIAANPDLEFGGPYSAPGDLAAMYAAVDLAWLIDRYEAGANSDWLLPNRLYEGCLHGAVPLALAGTEVARRLDTLGIGLIAAAPTVDAVADVLSGLDDDRLAGLAEGVRRHPRATWQADTADCHALVTWLAGLQAGQSGAATAEDAARMAG